MQTLSFAPPASLVSTAGRPLLARAFRDSGVTRVSDGGTAVCCSGDKHSGGAGGASRSSRGLVATSSRACIDSGGGVSRRGLLRLLLQCGGGAGVAMLVGSGSGAVRAEQQGRGGLEYPELRGLAEKSPDGLPPFRLVDGVQVQDVAEGDLESAVVAPGTTVSVKYVLRRSNGYFIDASYGFDRFDTFSFRPGTGRVIPAFDTALAGLHEGARRRFVVPPQLGYTAGTAKQDPGPIPPTSALAARSLHTRARLSSSRSPSCGSAPRSHHNPVENGGLYVEAPVTRKDYRLTTDNSN